METPLPHVVITFGMGADDPKGERNMVVGRFCSCLQNVNCRVERTVRGHARAYDWKAYLKSGERDGKDVVVGMDGFVSEKNLPDDPVWEETDIECWRKSLFNLRYSVYLTAGSFESVRFATMNVAFGDGTIVDVVYKRERRK